MSDRCFEHRAKCCGKCESVPVVVSLTPETLAEWRKDAETFHVVNYRDDRILALLDALAAEKAAREDAERKYGVEFDHHEETRANRAREARGPVPPRPPVTFVVVRQTVTREGVS